VACERRADIDRRLGPVAVAALAGALLVSTASGALASRAADVVENVATPDLDTVKEKVSEHIEIRIDRFDDVPQSLEGEDGV